MEGTLNDEGTYSHTFLSFVWITVSVLMVVEIVAIFVYYILVSEYCKQGKAVRHSPQHFTSFFFSFFKSLLQ